MSYILDALRRANSERERGTVPTLNADPGPADLAIDEDEIGRPAPRGQLMALWVACVVGLIAVGFGVSWLWGRSERPAAALLAQQQEQQQPTPPAARPAPAPVPTPQAAPAVATPQAATVPLSVPPLVEPARTLPTPTAAPQPVAASAQSKEDAAPRIPGKAELPEDIRRQLPPIVTNGAMYSDTPANRMVIINGQVFHESDKVTPDLVLEQIMLKGAVLSFKGQRFSISY